MESLFARALACLMAGDIEEKRRLTTATADAWRRGELSLEDGPAPVAVPVPGRPDRPRLVEPRKVAQRKLTSPEGRAALIHALAHIEFNAINLAWDAVYRFRGLPSDFYGDWIKVAAEESYHFGLLRERLAKLGHQYGDFDAHDGLWEMACKTADDVMVRMALVPRVLEARGLDVTPGMMDRLRAVGDEETVAILEIIFRDEIGHVEIGSRWFRHACEGRGLDPAQTFAGLLQAHMKGRIRGPFAEEARQQAGFGEDEMALLKTLSGKGAVK